MAKMQGRYAATHDQASAQPTYYAHTPFHHMEHNTSSVDAESFFNLGEGEILAEHVPADQLHHVKDCNEFPDGHTWMYDAFQPMLRAKYFSDQATKKEYPRNFKLDAVNVAVHLRRGDNVPVFDCEGPYQFTNRCMPSSITVQAMLKTVQLLAAHGVEHAVNFQIYTEDAIDIRGLEQLLPNEVHLNRHVNEFHTYHAFVSADILIIDHSSFSYSAGLFNDGIVLWFSFWHTKVDSWLEFDLESETILIPNQLVLDQKIKALKHRLSSR